MRTCLRIIAYLCWGLFSITSLIGLIDWLGRWNWFINFMLIHPHIAAYFRTPFPYIILSVGAVLAMRAEKWLKEPRLVARYTNSRTIPDMHSTTMQVWSDTEHKKPGWEDHLLNWDWFIEAQFANDSDIPTTVDNLAVEVSIKPKTGRKKIFKTQYREDLNEFRMNMVLNGQGEPHGIPFVGDRYRLIPSLIEKIRGVPLIRETSHRGWIHFKIFNVSQREMNSGRLRIDVWLLDAMQRRHTLMFKKKEDQNWDNNFYILPK